MRTYLNSIIQYSSIFLISTLYMTLLILAQLSFSSINDINLQLLVSLIMGILFPILIYLLNIKLFSYLKIEAPSKLNCNIKLIKRIVIGFFFSLIALYITGTINYFQTSNVNNFIFKLHFNLAIFNIITAIGEEVIFRGTLLHFFEKKKQKYIGLIISSIAFSLIHLLNLLIGRPVGINTIIMLTLAGLFLGLIYLNYGIVSAISAHYLWNLLHAGNHFNEENYSVKIALITLCLILFILHNYKIKSKKNLLQS